MNSLVLSALQYADDASHEGAGYTLKLHMISGVVFEIKVLKWTDKTIQLTLVDGTVIFIDQGKIIAVEVVW